MHFQKLVHLRHLNARAERDAALAAGLEQIRFGALFLGHRQDDRFLALEHLVVKAGIGHLGLRRLVHARQEAHQPCNAAHFLKLAQLVGHVVEIELALRHFLGEAFGFLVIDLGGGFLHQRDDVAAPEDAAGKALGVKGVQAINLFRDAEELDRQARDPTHGQRGAAAAIAIHPGQHQAGQLQTLVKALGGLHRILTGQGVRHQKGFTRPRHFGDLGGLAHHLFIDGGTARSIQDHHVIALKATRAHGALGDLDGGLAGHDRQAGDAGLLGHLRQLLHRRRTAGVERGDEDFLLLALGNALGELGGGGGFTRALKTRHQDRHRRFAGKGQAFGFALAAQQLHQTVMDDLDDLLAGADRADDLFADRLFADLRSEILHRRQGDVGLQQRHADFAQRGVHILFRERAAPGQAVKDAGKPF